MSGVGLNVGDLPAKQVYVGSTPVTAVYVGAQKVWPTIEVYEVSFSGEYGSGKLVPLVSVTVPAGEVWDVRVQGQFTQTTTWSANHPEIRIGPAISRKYAQGEVVDFSGTVSSSDSTIAAIVNRNRENDATDFVGTVTIEK